MIFSILGYWKEILIVLIVTCSLKICCGGLHMNGQFSCLIASLLMNLSIISLSKISTLPLSATIILLLVSIYAIYEQAPVQSPQMPIFREELIIKNRIRGIILSLTYSIIAIGLMLIHMYITKLDNYTFISQIITWAILFQALLMFQKREPKKESN
jgi:accessory gene regulator B